MKIKELTSWLESIAPLSLQESYDNAGLILGDPESGITGVLVCLDSTPEVVEEAVRNNCNLIIAHHPIIFSGLKKINGKNYIERTVIHAIKNDIAIYASHTNLDNVAKGVNRKISEMLGLKNLKILSPQTGRLKKLVTFAPVDIAEKVRQALFEAGAGSIGNYDRCSFSTEGNGTFRGNESSHPAAGEKGTYHTEREERIEVIFESWKQGSVLAALRQAHTYEEISFDVYPLDNRLQSIGSGMTGELPEPMENEKFLQLLKNNLKTGPIRHTALIDKKIEKIAVCGGAGSFLLQEAISSGADAFVTADFKYHQFFDADGKILIADVGHYESEQFTIELIRDLILKKFPTFAVRLTGIRTNPVFYT